MHVTSGLRTSRTWHVWLQRVHGRMRSACPARSLATRSGSAIWARVISTPAQRGVVVPAERPLGLTGVDDRALQHDGHVDGGGDGRGEIALKPAGWWKSGRVCSAEKIEPRTTTT